MRRATIDLRMIGDSPSYLNFCKTEGGWALDSGRPRIVRLSAGI